LLEEYKEEDEKERREDIEPTITMNVSTNQTLHTTQKILYLLFSTTTTTTKII